MTETPRKRIQLTPTKTLMLGYAVLILIGAALLCLPISSKSGEATPILTALFTSTSATCVTGLILVDTSIYWSIFGKTVILILIQIGGLGFITMTMAVVLFSGKRIGLKQRMLMQESLSAHQLGGIVKLTRFVLLVALIAELAGAALLSISFIPRFGAKGILYALFHSVSAFCNAGFDIMGSADGAYASLTTYSGDILVNLVVIVLILFGGLGFFVWRDLTEHRFKIKKYSLQTKAVLLTTLLLTASMFVVLLICERGNADFADSRILKILFASVTPRTAGFNTIDYALMSDAGKTLTIMNMLVGGSPGSTAGGAKTTTLIVLIACIFSTVRRRESTEMFGRRVSDNALKRAITIAMLYLLFFSASTVALCAIDNLPVIDSAFTTASAIGTVGLSSISLSPLSIASKLILTALMFFGRLGGLSLLYAMSANHQPVASRLPVEDVSVG